MQNTYVDTVSHWIQLMNKIRNNSISAPWYKRLNHLRGKHPAYKSYSFSRQGNTVVLSTKQLKRTALRGTVCFSKKAPEESRSACLLHFSPDWQHTPEEPRHRTRTLIQSDTPDLSRTARLAHRAARPARAEKATQRHAGSAIATHLGPP